MKVYTTISIVLIIAIAILSYSYVSSNRQSSLISTTSNDQINNSANNDVEMNSALKSYIVTFKSGKDTPDSVVKEVMDKFKDLGGQITNEYNTLLKGFSFSIPSGYAVKGTLATLEAEAQNPKFPFVIEEDQQININ